MDFFAKLALKKFDLDGDGLITEDGNLIFYYWKMIY